MKKPSEDLKIEIRPIPGRNGIKDYSENLEYFSQAHTICPFVNPTTLKYEVGLSKEDVEYLKEEGFPYELKANYVKGVPHPFWESQIVKVQLKNNPMFLEPGKNLVDFVKWKYLLVNSYIYNSEAEMKTGVKPEATHYIYNESEENAIKATALQKRDSLLLKISNLSLSRKRDIVLIVLNESVENKNDNYLTVKFDEIMKDKGHVAQLELLLNQDADDITLKAEIKTALQHNVLKKTKQGIFYFENNLGFAEQDVLEFLSKPENQELLLNIKSKIQ